uniref:Uncharacterized protein n=1 Tax=Arundo donax TaxID=35708 RepID=A0A0A8Y0K3_ARUDO
MDSTRSRSDGVVCFQLVPHGQTTLKVTY